MVGADPSFTDVHLLRTLYLLDDGPLSRKALVDALGVGEGSVRTILKRLTSSGYVQSTSKGNVLTQSGRSYLDKWKSRVSGDVEVQAGDLIPDGVSSALVLYGVADNVGSAVSARDEAIRAGADGAVILVCEDGLRFPGDGMSLTDYPLAEKSLSVLCVSCGDVLVVGFAKQYVYAANGAYAVALNLLDVVF